MSSDCPVYCCSVFPTNRKYVKPPQLHLQTGQIPLSWDKPSLFQLSKQGNNFRNFKLDQSAKNSMYRPVNGLGTSNYFEKSFTGKAPSIQKGRFSPNAAFGPVYQELQDEMNKFRYGQIQGQAPRLGLAHDMVYNTQPKANYKQPNFQQWLNSQQQQHYKPQSIQQQSQRQQPRQFPAMMQQGQQQQPLQTMLPQRQRQQKQLRTTQQQQRQQLQQQYQQQQQQQRQQQLQQQYQQQQQLQEQYQQQQFQKYTIQQQQQQQQNNYNYYNPQKFAAPLFQDQIYSRPNSILRHGQNQQRENFRKKSQRYKNNRHLKKTTCPGHCPPICAPSCIKGCCRLKR